MFSEPRHDRIQPDRHDEWGQYIEATIIRFRP